MRELVLCWEIYIERQGDYVEKLVCQFVAKILYFTSYFRLFKYTVSFSGYFTVYITYQPTSYIYIYTGCNRRNGPDFRRVFLMLNYTEKPQNTYIQS